MIEYLNMFRENNQLLFGIIVLWILFTIAAILIDIIFILQDDEVIFRDFVKTEEFRVYHIIVGLLFIPAWIIEGISYYVVWKILKTIYKVFYSLLNIPLVRRETE